MMATDSIHTAEVLVDSLATKSVTVTPFGATVVREIQDVAIHPGANAITIYGLDPMVDVDSIRIDGSGAATITDIQTEIVPRRETFEDVFPDDGSSAEEDDLSDPDMDDASLGVDSSALRAEQASLQAADAALEKARSDQAAALLVNEFLGNYGRSLHAKDAGPSQIKEFLELYHEERAMESEACRQANAEITQCEKRIAEIQKRVDRLQKAYEKAKQRALKTALREQRKRRRQQELRRQERERKKAAQRAFWMTTAAQVAVHLDGYTAMTPQSSRRSSIIEKTRVASTMPDAANDRVSLRLTYVLPKATWNSRYELSINTPTSTAHVVYRAELRSWSTETWSNTKVTLSTSQTSFSGISERIPVLEPWHVKVGLFGGHDNNAWKSGLRSNGEIGNVSNTKSKKKSGPVAYAQMRPGEAQLNSQPQFQLNRSLSRSSVGVRPRGGGLFGSSVGPQAPPPPPPPPPTGFGAAAAVQGELAFSDFSHETYNRRRRVSTEEDESSEDDSDSQTIGFSAKSLEHQASVHQAYGLTTTYDLPGQRTLAPSAVQRRHVLAELDLANVELSHLLIPKLRAAAFLKARLKNTSSVTLLPGQAGMTVDGTFLGSTKLSACAPGELLNLSLGVDPSILVTYGEPTVRRATSGFLSKEDSAVFTRTCWIKNTRAMPVSITVLDQVPVSEDEKLRVQILEPRGLLKDGDQVKMAVDAGSTKPGWGKGLVSLAKNGQVKWQLSLEKGRDVKLTLEYEIRRPSGCRVVDLD